MDNQEKLFLFSADLDGREAFWGVLGHNQYWAEKTLNALRKTGKVCEPDNPNTKVIRLELIIEDGSRVTAFKMFGYDQEFEDLFQKSQKK